MGIGTLPISMVDVGGPPQQNTSLLVARFRHRAEGPVKMVADMARGNVREDSWLNHPGVALRNPENVWGGYDHYARSRPGAVDVEMPPEVLRVNHYVDAFGARCAGRFLRCDVPDESLFWALPLIQQRLQLRSF